MSNDLKQTYSNQLRELYLKNDAFRDLIDVLMNSTMVMSSTFTGDPIKDAYANGARNIGLVLMSKLDLNVLDLLSNKGE